MISPHRVKRCFQADLRRLIVGHGFIPVTPRSSSNRVITLSGFGKMGVQEHIDVVADCDQVVTTIHQRRDDVNGVVLV